MLSIEESIFRSLLYDDEYVRRVVPYLEDEYFDGSHRTLFKTYKSLFDKYNKVPNLDALAITLNSSSIGEQEFEEILTMVEDIQKNKKDIPDTDWLVDETEQYCKDKKLYNSIYKSIDIINGNDPKLDKHAIPQILDEALAISFDQTIGMEFSDDAERRWEMYTSEESRLAFPLKALNILSNGGLKKKSLSCILAGTNVGKSALMCYLAGEFLKQGKNVVYISMEMAEEEILERVDANLLNVSTDDLKTMSKDKFVDGIQKIKSKTTGRLYTKQYPTSAAHSGHFRHFLKELKQKKKFKPDLVMIDYINICASSRYKSMNGVNSYSYIKAIAEEIRALAVEFDIPILTATQVNRGGMNEDAPDMTSTSESFGLPATLDFFVSLSANEVLRENGQQLVHLLKTRWGNKQRVTSQVVGIEWDKMRYYDVGQSEGDVTTAEVQAKVGKSKPSSKKQNLDNVEWD